MPTVQSKERGQMMADLSVQPAWRVPARMEVRREWLVIRQDDDGRLTYMLLNAAETNTKATLIERNCWRYFT